MLNCLFVICFCFLLFIVGLLVKDDFFNVCEKVNLLFNYCIINVKLNWEISFLVRCLVLKVYE